MTTPEEVDSAAAESGTLQAGRKDLELFFSECCIKDEVKVLSTRVLENRCMSLSEKEVKLFWTNNTLQSYVDNQRAPRGLRSYKEVSQYHEDKDFVIKWKQAHLDHSLNLLKIVLERSKTEYDQVCNDLESVKKEIQARLTEAQWQLIQRKIEKKLIPIQNEIKERKRDKFMRDKLDYDLDRVFTWKNQQRPRRNFRGNRNRRTRKTQPDYWTTDSGSDSSVTEDAGAVSRSAGSMDTSSPTSASVPLGAGSAGGADVRRRNMNIRGGTKRKQVSWR